MPNIEISDEAAVLIVKQARKLIDKVHRMYLEIAIWFGKLHRLSAECSSEDLNCCKMAISVSRFAREARVKQ